MPLPVLDAFVCTLTFRVATFSERAAHAVYIFPFKLECSHGQTLYSIGSLMQSTNKGLTLRNIIFDRKPSPIDKNSLHFAIERYMFITVSN